MEGESINKGANTKVIVESSFIKIWIDGPAVSLQGSPTVYIQNKFYFICF